MGLYLAFIFIHERYWVNINFIVKHGGKQIYLLMHFGWGDMKSDGLLCWALLLSTINLHAWQNIMAHIQDAS